MKQTDSASPDWIIRGSRVALRLSSGDVVDLTAAEIAGAEFKDRFRIRGIEVPCRPSEGLLNINFHRFPPDASLELIPPASDLSKPPTYRVRLSGLDVSPPLDQDQALFGNDWYPLPTDLLSKIHELLAAAGVSGQMTVKQYLSLRCASSDLITVAAEPPPAASVDNHVSTPAGLNAVLYPYQVNGFQWLGRIADEGLGCLLGDEMGLGKTLQVISLLLREAERQFPSLVIAPATLLENWRRETERFAPSLSVHIHRGRDRTGYPRVLAGFKIVLCSYETAVRDMSILEMVSWNVVVLDEGQAIKNPNAQRTLVLKSIPRRVSIVVTGTPVENRLRDLWSLMDFAVPEFLGELDDFEQTYSNDIDGAADLEPLVSPLILRRLVADVAKDLPERIDIPQAIDLSDESAARYDALRQKILADCGSSASLVALTKLRMYCAHPFLLEGGAGDPLPHSTKYARLVEILEEVFASGEKALVFTSYQEMADILEADLKRRFGVPATVIDGRVAVSDRQSIVDRFGTLSTPAVLVLNPKAAGTGLNITAANHVVHYNLEWNPATEDQATARAHRRGQTRPVTVHRLFHAATVEDVIDQRMQRKREIAANAVVGTEGSDHDLSDVLSALNASPMLKGIA